MKPAWICLIALLSFTLGATCSWLLPRSAPVNAAPPNPKILDLSIADGGIYRVRSIVDGDTIVLENGLHLRYHGMNAPETGRWVHDVSPIAAEATARNIQLVEGKRIRLKLASDPIDMHGRIVANLFVVPEKLGEPEIEVREVMLKEGFAKFMGLKTSPAETKVLKAWESEAKESGAGIWGVTKPDDWPKNAKPFCASSTSKIYHAVTCTTAKRITAANLHEYATAEEAEAVGLKPCAHCLGKK